MTIRNARAEDLGQVINMTEHFLEASIYGPLLRMTLPQIITLVHNVWTVGAILLADGPPIVGMIGLLALDHPMNGQRVAQEIAWWVEPSARGRTGLELLKAAEAWSRQSDCTLLQMVAPANSQIGRFYERAGYQIVESAYVKGL